MRRKTTLADIISGFAGFLTKEAKKEVDQKIRDQKEKERSKRLKEGSIDVEFKVIEVKDEH